MISALSDMPATRDPADAGIDSQSQFG